MIERNIGLEYEFLAVQLENGQAITRDIIKAIWRDWAEQDHVELYTDYATKQPVGVKYTEKDGREIIINTDAGVDIVEFGFNPFPTLSECERNMLVILKEFLVVASRHGVGLIATGMQPKTPCFFPDLKSEKIWYRGFARLPHFAVGHHMFHNIAAHQPCIDISYDEVADVINTFNAIAGVTIALFANSGVGEYQRQCCHEEREHRWNKWVGGWGPDREKIVGIPKKQFRNFRDYLEYNWTIELPSVFRGKTMHVIDPPPRVLDYLKGGSCAAFDVGNVEPSEVKPEMRDANDLNQYIWIQSRIKYFFDEKQNLRELLSAYDRDDVDKYARKHLTKLYVETRNIASQPWDAVLAAPAFLLGLIENIAEAKNVVDGKPWEYWRELREKTIKNSLEVDEVVPLAEQLVRISERGLQKRGFGEEKYLAPLFERLHKRESPAVRAIRDFEEMGVEKFIESRMIQV
ncbi:MAG: hypothetical protein A3C90_00445 [Candidatus Magasanikbacteria bacterium RIFCSPHIGHO2_02_FULL_51_14]|uniref:glutamate--cysteine ligase n=1 Tax=Candidatus Magasanikbacteria bacterium RIFCSPHIGHO2_02_FULL_51_14 TaxID=1798683 RepID=A0A1F6MEH9_9BACT|nr:MAG: hypothetical protein A3C90_00445 [Candidatus Magasanikbacteria bacterium RIFCSPHIGHO2_02_FULL_51_14]